jgi:tRNA pseudouridine-54 N-methylase
MMNTEKIIPDAKTRARNVARLQKVCLEFDHLNMLLEQASAIAEAELQNSPLFISTTLNEQN